MPGSNKVAEYDLIDGDPKFNEPTLNRMADKDITGLTGRDTIEELLQLLERHAHPQLALRPGAIGRVSVRQRRDVIRFLLRYTSINGYASLRPDCPDYVTTQSGKSMEKGYKRPMRDYLANLGLNISDADFTASFLEAIANSLES